MTLYTISCPECERLHSFDGNLSFREECDACAHDLHVCLTCDFHDQYAENQCRETTADPVNQKDRRNLCEYWKPKSPKESSHQSAAEAKAKLHAFFGEDTPITREIHFDHSASHATPASPSSSEADEAKRKLEALFKK
tara:strand:- start:73 stop:486 length:414 start_codon:yes stop_codon:yes gene_type:complete